MPYRAGKLFGSGLCSGRSHSPGPYGPRLHSPRVSGCKLMQLPPRAVRPAGPPPAALSPAERPLLVSRDLPPLADCDLITQIYAAQQDLPLREFASYFNGRTHNNVPPCLTSHEDSNTRMSAVIPLYPSFQQSVKWDPNQPTSKAHDYNCRCVDCTSARCPGEVSTSLSANKNFKFKSNIMRFCDQHTMTPKVNDVSCGICLGVGALSQNKSIDTCLNSSKVDLRKYASRPAEPTCMWAPPILKHPSRNKKPKRDRRKTLVNEDCEDSPCWSRRWYGEDKAVRDTDPADYCNEQMDEAVSCRYPTPQNVMYEEDYLNSNETNTGQFNPMSAGPVRKMLYNEGISDDIANNLSSRCHRKEAHTQLRKKQSNPDCGLCCPEGNTWIPYSHKRNSRYHVDCKKPPEQRYRCDVEPGDIYRVVDCPRRFVKRIYYSKSLSPGACMPLGSHLPKKMLTSEKDIDSFIVCKGDCNEKYDWKAN